VISQIDEFKGTWRALGTLAPHRLSALRRLMMELVTRFVDERKTKHLHPLLLIGVWVVVFPGDPPVPGWPRPLEPRAHHLAPNWRPWLIKRNRRRTALQ
jgi:hypothetical protein